MEEKVLVPFAPILIESTRSIGYSFEAALADIIDNSIGNGARNVDVYFQSKGDQYVAVLDDACGMDEEELESAMRYGSRSSLEARDEHDLGRFGLGLKMASLSQCRKLSVVSKKNNEYQAAKWDLDYVLQKGDWMLQKYSGDEIAAFRLYDELIKYDSGTIVIWEDFDRIALGAANTQRVFDEKLDIARDHVSLVFHRFMNEEAMMRRVKINFNGAKVEPIDPFLTGNAATQPLIEQTISVDGSQIRVKPYILPHLCKLTPKDKKQVGGSDDLRQTQGFYVYRNKRLIIWGTWFRLIKQHELNKLARVRVDIPNTLDHIWEIDVKKSSASLPDLIKKNLVGIVENSVGRSERVYKYRGRKVDDGGLQHVWNKVDNRGNIQYLINREMPMFKLVESMIDEQGALYFDQFVKIIEDAFPYAAVYYDLAKNDTNINEPNLEFEEVYQIALDMIKQVADGGGDVVKFAKTIGKIDFFIKYPDVVKRIVEEYGNE